ncbi:replication initiator protein A [Sporolactobacillus terrae]|uniref:replication initiator protein A n=1 Tax=Sporolactobacillus terrae TaxID=269673 RepID=UPI001CBCB530|nr:replication initiator protein A [Sporolactobacillus terrae]UAK16112.1 replication initiator protein A [Sporolactobacillus terrae]
MIKYYTEDQTDNLIYVQTPKVLIYGSKYKDMMPQAKMLYMVLMDKIKLSMANGWKDKKGRHFVIMSIEYASEMLGFSASTIRRCKGELRKYELIEEKRMGLNQPNRIYVGRLSYTDEDLYKLDSSRSVQSEHSRMLNENTHECPIRAPYNNKNINNELNNNELKDLVNKRDEIVNNLWKQFSRKGMKKELFFRVLSQIELQEKDGTQIEDFERYFARALHTAMNKSNYKRGLKEPPRINIPGLPDYDWLNDDSE